MNPGDVSAEILRDEHLTQAAAEWLIRRGAGLNSAEAAEFAAWHADPRHAIAFARVEKTQHLLFRLPQAPTAAALMAEADSLMRRARPAKPSRLHGWPTYVTLAAAACVTVALWLAWPTLRPERDIFATLAGQRQSVTLNDGSTLVLNGDSEVQVAFAAAERRVQLHRGEAHFFVAKDPARPFFVSADKVTIRAVGTAFNVRREANAIDVLVTEGKVQVTHGVTGANGAAALPIYLVSGESVHIDTLSSAIAVASDAAPAGEKLLHSAPRLVFSDTPLGEVVALFNRYNQLQIEIAEPELALRAVRGNFDADNAESFIALMERSGDAQIERVSPTKVRLHKAP
ncbi:FecR family protein [Opitutus terrae]|uniref:Anti-FecI sigma factor, FecR n=1 Tax=Opitutus terrae (strain DSM 11246 / JCM 15787 / PB90-1) TaxID=452637 RepID=B1ZXK1_OPITP|nr:FecR domain-containing protein [Opitutus terrae]ACB76996.1 anti-FecI sigma factor, FecR [Opitutus terrae PB90-1]